MANAAEQIVETLRLTTVAQNGTVVQLSGAGTAGAATTAFAGVVASSLNLASGSPANVVLAGVANVLCVAGLTLTPGVSLLWLSATAGRATTDASSGIFVGTVVSIAKYATADLVVTSLAASGTSQNTQALWPLATTRYYAVDYVGGSDTNIGFSDVSMAAAGIVAIKTLTRLRAIVPSNGLGRSIVIAVKGDPLGITDVQYLKPDGVTLDDLDLRDISGYRFWVCRTTRDFANSATDKKVLAPAQGQAGPGTGGVWTCAAGGTTSIFTVASGTLTAELLGITSLNGMRVRFTGNVTAALTDQALVIWRNTSTQITLGRTLTVAPADGDTFTIEVPGVSVDNIFINSDLSGAGGITNAGGVSSTNVVGFRARQNTFLVQFLATMSNNLRLSFFQFDRRASVTNVANLQCLFSYYDEASVLASPGSGLRWTQNDISLMFNNFSVNLFMQDCALLAMGLASTINRALALTIGVACYLNTSGFLLSINGSNASRSGVFGANASGPTFLMALVGRCQLSDSPLLVNGIDLISAGAFPCLTIRTASTMGLLPMNIGNLSSSGGGNTDVVIDSTGMRSGSIVFSTGIAAGMATLGDLRVAGPVVIPFTTFASANNYVDVQGNNYQDASGVTVTRITAGTLANFPALSADPPSPAIGDMWITDNGGARNLCVRVAGPLTVRTLLT